MPGVGEGIKTGISVQPAKERPNLPGGQVRMRPIETDGKFYDPLHPPKLHISPDGKLTYQGGKELDKDTAYSMKFWAKPRPKGFREAMQDNITSAIKEGQFSQFAGFIKDDKGATQLNEDSKEKLSAYRKLAEEMGYIIGPFKPHVDAGTVMAEITKIKTE